MPKIYTKTGDKGDTGLFGGERVRKDHPRIQAYGAVDELNAAIGQVRALIRLAPAKPAENLNDHETLNPILEKIQNDLFDLGAVLASPQPKRLEGKASGFVRKEDVSFLEETIDRLDRELPPLRSFILPGGSELGSALHLARTVCRRAEREIISLATSVSLEPEMIEYVNRLSDLLFVLARWVNLKAGVAETAWKKK